MDVKFRKISVPYGKNFRSGRKKFSLTTEKNCHPYLKSGISMSF